MSPSKKIEIEQATWRRLQKLAVALIDTEDSVINRLIDSYEAPSVTKSRKQKKLN